MGRPGFRRVLAEVARVWKEDPASALRNAAVVREALGRMAAAPRAEIAELDGFAQATVGRIDGSYDPVYAGFGQQPKFPHPTAVSLYFWHAWAHQDARSGARGIETLRRMADGGMYDQLAGGFHRYSVDEGWHIPHFEKMAADNAQLLGAFVEGAQRAGDRTLDGTIQGILGWTESTLTDAKGGFAASQDADNAPGDDGSYFTWSRSELKAALTPEEFRILSKLYGVDTEGRMPHDPDRNVLFRAAPLEEVAAALSVPLPQAKKLRDDGRAKLLTVRANRPSPVVDRALYAHLNGAYIRSLVAAGRYLGDPRATALARGAADRFLRHAYEPGRGVAHRLEGGLGLGFGLLEDQVEFGLGLAELAVATVDRRYAEAARDLADLADREFRDESGLLRDLAPKLYDGPSIGSVAEASYPLEDSPHLSANSAWALLQIRLSNVLGDESRRTSATRHVRTVASRISASGLFAAGTALAAGLLETPPARVVVEGRGPGAEALARAAERSYHPNLVVFRGTPPAPFSLPEELVGAASGGGPVRALVCFGSRCLPPITEASEIGPALSRGLSASGA
jgi:uncharacterized protein YyaL (SSP411 family)